ncbi:MAG: hypothetical protein M1358_04365 [Chloroflexi bacterium]|nr:hypothetical protein [Chloroflexota bacterium]
MPETVEVVVPQFSVNDVAANLTEWYVSDGASVAPGDLICGLETSKAAFDIEAIATGYIVHLVDAGMEVRTGDAVALVGPNLEDLREEKVRRLAEPVKTESTIGGSSGAVRATRKAETLAQELGIDLAAIGGNGIIREEDVRRFADKRNNNAQAPREGWVASVSRDEAGFVAPEFLAKIEKDPAFAQLGPDLKVHLYRTYGAQIGENVKIGSGSVILSRVIRLADDSAIGSDCYVKTDRFVLGRMSVIGNRTRIVTREVVAGDVLFSGENILIGGGGAFGPRSALRIGDNCLISSNCLLNTGEPITIGDEVGLSPNVQLYTHNHWQNVLRGYTARHAPIVVERGAYVTGNCLVAPGVRIGEGATVLANSVVSFNVDPYTIVSGNPAQAVGKVNTVLSEAQKDRIVRHLMTEMEESLRFLGVDTGSVVYLPSFDCLEPTKAEVVLTFQPTNLPDSLGRPVVFDLTAFQVHGSQTRLSGEVRNFLRRRGIRFKPHLWRYTHDEGFYVQ